MGCAASTEGIPKGSKEEQKTSHDIDVELEDARKEMARETKLLLLGAGESGKSTLAKQIKIIHLQGYTEEEVMLFVPIIYSNIVNSVRSICDGLKKLKIPVEDPHIQEICQKVEQDECYQYFNGDLTQEMAAEIKLLWTDPNVQFYFDNLDRIISSGYVPTNQDILHSRTKTTGINEIKFNIHEKEFRMIDVGGQRSERRKWIHCFQDVTAVIFCVALSEFDMRLYEDDITNRMQESLKLWKETCGTKWFINTNLILFFTKDDIFREKMTTGASIRSCFTDYNGPDEYQASVDYIVQQFKAQNKNHNKTIDCHVLCATDTTVVDRLFNDIQEAIITNLVNTKAQSV